MLPVKAAGGGRRGLEQRRDDVEAVSQHGKRRDARELQATESGDDAMRPSSRLQRGCVVETFGGQSTGSRGRVGLSRRGPLAEQRVAVVVKASYIVVRSTVVWPWTFVSAGTPAWWRRQRAHRGRGHQQGIVSEAEQVSDVEAGSASRLPCMA